tara:strand:+ start:172 stop:699 length:528 start_codon:yes stop_codon:yes gene_type:complete
MNELIKRLVVVGESPRPTSRAALKEFEGAREFAFPKSYAEFVMQLGPGELSQYFRMYAPGYSCVEEGSLDHFVALTNPGGLAQLGFDADLVKRMLPFCDTLEGDLIAWDPATRDEEEQSEMAIFCIPRYSADSGVTIALASTFHGFVEKVCLTEGGFNQVLDLGEPIMEYQPFQP